MMETVYYENSYQVPLRDTLKRKMTLELNSEFSKLKKTKYNSLQTPIFQNEVLASPDLQMCKLASPDIENMIQAMPVHTPNMANIFFPKSVTGDEHDCYDTTGFDDALNNLRKQNQLQNSINTTTTQYTTLQQIQQTNPYPPNMSTMYPPSESISGDDDSSLLSESSSAYGSVGDISRIKQEPLPGQTSPGPPINPVDMESQERIKLERKRQRNRVAASKCRKRKLEKISNLEKKVAQLKKENGDLNLVLEKLQNNVGDLKEQVMKHVQSGCQILVTQAQQF